MSWPKTEDARSNLRDLHLRKFGRNKHRVPAQPVDQVVLTTSFWRATANKATGASPFVRDAVAFPGPRRHIEPKDNNTSGKSLC